VRGRLQNLRRKIHVEPSALGQAAHELSGVQKAGAQSFFQFQFAAKTKAAVHLGREKGGIHRAQKNQKRRIRKAVIKKGRDFEIAAFE
jgi:hypothetical protein